MFNSLLTFGLPQLLDAAHSPTFAGLIIPGISPAGNFILTQNSVAVLTSIGAGAIVNTLYLKEGNVGIGTGVPRYKSTTIGVLSSLLSDDGTNYEGLTITPTAGSVSLAAVTAGTGTDNVNIILTPAGTGSAKVGSNVIAQGGGSTGATVTAAGTVTLIIDGTTYYLLRAAAA